MAMTVAEAIVKLSELRVERRMKVREVRRQARVMLVNAQKEETFLDTADAEALGVLRDAIEAKDIEPELVVRLKAEVALHEMEKTQQEAFAEAEA